MDVDCAKIEKSENNFANENLASKVPFLGIRHVQVALIFYLTFIANAIKSFLSVAVVAMTEENSSPNPDVTVFHWDNNSVILSSYLWGYVIFHVYAGHAANIYGPKWFLFAAVAVTGTFSHIMPVCAEYFGSTAMIICRVGQGLAMGFVYPSIHGIFGKWLPVEERSQLGSLSYSGCYLGTIFATLASGYLSASWLGWPSIFYLIGGICYLWCILWVLYGFDSPEVHPKISKAEKEYISASLGQQEGVQHVLKTPWIAILTSVPFLAIFVANIGVTWVSNTFALETPTYMVKVLGLGVTDASLMTTISSIVSPFATFFSAIVADKLINKKIFSTIAVRKLFQVISTILPAILYGILGYLPTDQIALCVTLITTALVLGNLTVNSLTVNYMDLSPNFAALLIGISNGFGQIISIFAPLLIQFFITDETDLSQWRLIFLTTSGLVTAGTLFYVIFASAERQWWDQATEKQKNENK